MEIKSSEIFQRVVDNKASDLHLSVGVPPIIRVNKKLTTLPGYTVFKNDDILGLLKQILDAYQLEKYLSEKELDFSFGLGEQARFRANAFFQKGFSAASFRAIPYKIPSLTDLNLPPIIAEFAKLPRGFVLVTGATGHGKSSTLASLIDSINKERATHIIT
ncbi:type IV pili twitching motility protein PilT, partial [Patescibacteria group bacterium]|nr:type IV pili twitching motility protein PilT [Patescibacteria group bacterium]